MLDEIKITEYELTLETEIDDCKKILEELNMNSENSKEADIVSLAIEERIKAIEYLKEK